MADVERYLEFMENESNLGNQERALYSNIAEVGGLVKLVAVSNPDFPTIKAYVLKNLSVLFNYAPHLSMQAYLASLVSSFSASADIFSQLRSLLEREDLPAKSYSIINSYISVLKERETEPPSMSIASDEKIVESINNMSPQKIATAVMLIQLRLQMGEKSDHFVTLLNPFMEDPNRDPLYKVTLLRQLFVVYKKYPSKLSFHLLLGSIITEITFDGTFEEEYDPFLRGSQYYLEELKLSDSLNELVSTTCMMFRIVNLNTQDLLNSEQDVKGFIHAVLEAYKANAEFYINSQNVPETNPELKKTKGYNQARGFMQLVYRSRY